MANQSHARDRGRGPQDRRWPQSRRITAYRRAHAETMRAALSAEAELAMRDAIRSVERGIGGTPLKNSFQIGNLFLGTGKFGECEKAIVVWDRRIGILDCVARHRPSRTSSRASAPSPPCFGDFVGFQKRYGWKPSHPNA